MSKEYRDKDWLYTQRFVKRLSLRRIAALCDVSYECIRKQLIKHGLFKDSDELLKRQSDELIRLAKENADFVFAVLCKTEKDRKFWEDIIYSDTEKEAKQHYAEHEKKQSEGRVVHRKVHPDDYAKIGMDSKSNPRDYGNTFAEEMSIIQEIADR